MLSLKAILGLDGSGFELGLKRAQSSAEKFSKSVGQGISSRLGQFLTVAAVEQAIQKTVKYASEVKDLSDRLEISTDAVQQWEHAVTQAGGSAEGVAKFFEALASSRDKALGGDQNAMGAFKKLGVSERDLRDMRLEDIGLKIGNTFKGGDAQKLIGSLREIGGKGVGEMVAAMKSGLEESFAGAPLIKTEDIIRLDEMGDQFATLGKSLLAAFAPVIVFLTNSLKTFVDQWRSQIGGLIDFAGTLLAGGSFGDASAAFVKAGSDVAAEKAEAERRIQEQISAINGRSSGGGSTATPSDDAAKAAAKESKRIGDMQKGINANPLQTIGARVAFVPLQTELQKTVQALKENTAALKAKAAKNIHDGFDGSSVQYGSNGGNV
jgi:hypothetical protein